MGVSHPLTLDGLSSKTVSSRFAGYCYTLYLVFKEPNPPFGASFPREQARIGSDTIFFGATF